MKRTIGLIAAAAILAGSLHGCARNVRWSHPGVSGDQFVEIRRDCESRADAILARDRKIDADHRTTREADLDRAGVADITGQMTEQGYDVSRVKLVNRCLEGYGFKQRRTWGLDW